MIELAIADRSYSSWSLRGHLLVELAGAPSRPRFAALRSEDFEALRAEFAPARTVPAARFGDGTLVWDSLALAEELADRFPDAALWPAAPQARAAARALCAEMHSGFQALRRDCPMNLLRRHEGFAPSAEVEADVARIESLWAWARERFADGGPWLFGARPTAADAFYAPVAARFVTYGLGRDPASLAYAETIFAWAPFRRWRAMGEAEHRVVERHERDLPQRPRFGPAPRPARPVADAQPVNEACPYSGRPVAPDSLAEIDGRVIGFCNPFCRDKSVADAEAWPRLRPLLP